MNIPEPQSFFASGLRLPVALHKILCAVVVAGASLVSTAVFANTGTLACSALFSHGIQSHDSGGKITVGLNAQVLNSPAHRVRSTEFDDRWFSIWDSCGDQRCQPTGDVAPQWSVEPNFAESANNELYIASSAQEPVILADSYKQIDVAVGVEVTLSAADQVAQIKHLKVGYNADVTLMPGDYWINSLSLASLSQIQVESGIVRLFIAQPLDMPWRSRLNSPAAGESGDPSRLLVYSSSSISLGVNATVSGLVYAQGEFHQDFQSTLYGSVSAASSYLGTSASTHYSNAAVMRAETNEVCLNAGIDRSDIDHDGIPDSDDADIDGDGIANHYEVQLGFNPRDADDLPADADGDGIPDILQVHQQQNACRASFPNAAQTHAASGEIQIQHNAQLHNASSVILHSPTVTVNPWSQDLSCVTSHCRAAGIALPPLELGAFRVSSADRDLLVGFREQVTLGENGDREYDTIITGSESTLTLTGDRPEYRIRRLTVGYQSELRLAPGDYWVERLLMGANASVNVQGAGTVRLHVKDSLYVPFGAQINVAAANPSQLLLYGYNDIVLHTGSETHALIYAQNDVELQFGSLAFGAVNGANVYLFAASSLNYDAQAVVDADFGGWCDLDNDGIYDELDPDRDGDGVPNDIEVQMGTDPDDASDVPPDTDGDGIPDVVDPDRDGDGYDNQIDAFPDDATEWHDLDGDGTGDNSDADIDGDGISNDYENELGTDPADPGSVPPDSDGDGIPNVLDNDRDGDGHNDDVDVFPDDGSEWADLDGDGQGDNSDPDRDGDGVSNDHEVELGFDPNDPSNVPPDADGDGLPDALDPDRDGDGRNNNEDAFPDDPAEWSDLDGDGVGDNTDPDRDGDGFNNATETERGTNPDDAGDYPDDVPPSLHLNNPTGSELKTSSVILTGTVSDPQQPYSGVARAVVESAAFPDVVFTATLENDRFEAEVPLVLGDNSLTVTAFDLSGNTTSASFETRRISPPHFANVTPENGALITDETVTIAGEVRTLLPLSEVQFFINDWQITPTGTGQEGVYVFNLPKLPLAIGTNRFEMKAVTADGTDERLLVLSHRPENAGEIPPPDIELLTPTDGSLLNSASFPVKGQVTSHAGAVSVTLNGREVNWQGTPDAGYFEGIVSFPANADAVTVTVVATDSLGKSRESTFRFSRDDQPPRILMAGGLAEAPAVNRVTGSPIALAGTVIDSNLVSVSLNDQPMRLRPGAGEGQYDFGVALNIAPGGEKPVTLAARDRSGNLTTVAYIFESDAALGVEMLLPAKGTELTTNGGPVNLNVAARLTQVPQGSTASVRVDSGSAIPMTLAGTLASADLSVPAEAGEHRITVNVFDAGGSLVATTSRTVAILDAGSIELELVRAEPEVNQAAAQTNAPIELYFNKALDPAKLTITVRETLHGKTYVNLDPRGADFLQSEGYQLKTVIRDRELVPGELRPLPGNQSFAFFPARHFGFAADIYVDVMYEGQDVSRYRFQTRPLPTFVSGGVRDQFGRPLAGIEVALPEFGLSTATNADGSFGFGAQTRPGEEIPGGRHEMLINPGFTSPGYGSQRVTVILQKGQRNELPLYQLPELSPEVPFQTVNASQTLVSFAGDDLVMDLSGARLVFGNGRPSGEVQVQFFPYQQLSVSMMPSLAPLWAYGAQPRGIEVEGNVSVRMAMPQLRGSYDYIPPDTERVVLLGYDKQREMLAPIGVGRIENHQVVSEGSLALTSLDYLAYVIVLPEKQRVLAEYANGQISLNQLISELR